MSFLGMFSSRSSACRWRLDRQACRNNSIPSIRACVHSCTAVPKSMIQFVRITCIREAERKLSFQWLKWKLHTTDSCCVQVIPRSLLFAEFEGESHLLAGLGDGHLFNFHLDVSTGEIMAATCVFRRIPHEAHSWLNTTAFPLGCSCI